ncbi:MAG: hypothetical protein AAFX53_14350 [Bacteroidota bacterium]
MYFSRMMGGKRFFIFFGISFLISWAWGQDCTLDIGGADEDMMVQVFQLNEEQLRAMQGLKGDLLVKNKSTEEEIQILFEGHPQSTPEELQLLADKYRVLQQKMVGASRDCDTKFLAMLNQRQYERYLELCFEAFRKPIRVTPITPKKKEEKE